jgi:hypothetical protein
MNYLNDDYMQYDLASHKYVITEKALMEDKGLDIRAQFVNQPDVDVPAFLKRVTMVVYGWLYRGVQNKDESEYALSLPRFRDAIKEALEEQANAMLTSRTDPTLFFSDKASLHPVSPMVEAMTQESGIYFRGKWSEKIIPQGFYKTRGEDY